MSLEKIKRIATEYKRSPSTLNSWGRSELSYEIRAAQDLLARVSTANTVAQIQNFLAATWKRLKSSHTTFYIQTPRSNEAEALFIIAKELVPKNAEYPNGAAYQLLMPTLENQCNCITTEDLPENPADIIISSNGHHLLSITTIGGASLTYNYEDTSKYCLDESELAQISRKRPSVYDQLQRILLNTSGTLSPETVDKLKTVVEVALSYNGSSPEEINHLKAHILHAMESDQDFADYMEKYDFDSVQDTYSLLSNVYNYLQEYRAKLPGRERNEFDQLQGESSERIITRFQKMWDRDPSSCGSMTAEFLADFVCQVADPSNPFANAQYLVHMGKQSEIGKRQNLVQGDKGSFILEILTGNRYRKDYRWYHLISPYHKGEKQTPWLRLFAMTILSLGIVPIFYLLKNCAKLIIGGLFKYPEMKFDALAFYFARESAKYLKKSPPSLLGWAGSKLMQGFFKLWSSGFSLGKNAASLFIAPVQTIKKTQRYLTRIGYEWRGTANFFTHFGYHSSLLDRSVGGLIWLVSNFVWLCTKVLWLPITILDKISFTLTSPLEAYQKVSERQGKSQAAMLALGVSLTFCATVVLAAPAIEALTNLILGAQAQLILNFFAQLPSWLPMVSDVLSPMGSGLASIIQPIVGSLGLSTNLVFATSTLILVPLLLMQLAEGATKIWEHWTKKDGSGGSPPTIPPPQPQQQPIAPNFSDNFSMSSSSSRSTTFSSSMPTSSWAPRFAEQKSTYGNLGLSFVSPGFPTSPAENSDENLNDPLQRVTRILAQGNRRTQSDSYNDNDSDDSNDSGYDYH